MTYFGSGMFVQWQEVANIALPLFQRNPLKSHAEQPDDAVQECKLSGIVIPGDFIFVQKGEHRISISLKTLLILRKEFLLS